MPKVLRFTVLFICYSFTNRHIIIKIQNFFFLVTIYKGGLHWSVHCSCFFQWQTIPVQLDESCDWKTAITTWWQECETNITSSSFIRHICSPLTYLFLLTHFIASSKMNPDKQHLSRNRRHTYWAQISTFRVSSEEKPQRGLERWKKKPDKKHINNLQTSKRLS